MGKVTRVAMRVDVAAPVADVFAFVADYRNALHYMAHFRSFQPLTTLTSGIGARVQVKGQLRGIPIATELEIVGFEENRRLVSVSRRGIRSRSEWLFEPHNAATQVTFRAEYELPKMPLGGLICRFVEDEIRASTRLTLQNLKRILERQSREGGVVHQDAHAKGIADEGQGNKL